MRLAILVVLAFGLASVAHAAGTKSVKDWTAVCSNLGACVAFGFSAEGTDAVSFIKIDREAGGAAPPHVTLAYDTGDEQPAQTWTVSIDGRPLAGLGPVRASGGEGGARASVAGAPAGALIAAMRNGRSLELNQGGKVLSAISLAGSAAILLWVDDQQGRLDSVTALTRRGPKPGSAVPPPVAPPLVPVAPPVVQGGLPQRAPRRLIAGVADCDLGGISDPDDIVARLAPGVALWGPQCQMAAYNEVSIFYIGDEEAQHLRRIVLPEAPGSGQASDDELINAAFDPKTQTLSSFSKGRGLGDCGSSTDWVWDGRAFELLSERVMPECRGVTADDWPPLFIGRRK
jgi:hypothetical protein